MTENDLLMTNAKKSLSGERFKIFEKNLNTSGLNRDELSNQIRSQSWHQSKGVVPGSQLRVTSVAREELF